MIYKTTGFKNVKRHGRKSKRNMRGGGFSDYLPLGMPIGVVLIIVAINFLFAFGIILKCGGGSKTQ